MSEKIKTLSKSSLLTIGIALINLGVESLKQNLETGAIQILLGLAVLTAFIALVEQQIAVRLREAL